MNHHFHFIQNTGYTKLAEKNPEKEREWVFEVTKDGGWKMKPKTFVDADEYDHFRINDDINNKFNEQKLDTSYKSDISSETKKAANDPATSPLRNNKKFIPPQYKPYRPNFRPYNRRKPFNSSPFYNKDRDYRTGRFGDRSFRGKDFRYKSYPPRRPFIENRSGRTDWIDGMCWFHYTKGESATSCLDSHRCSGYKSFHKKNKEA